jgi:hypothetical protein
MDTAWAIDVRDQCRRTRVPFFFKQLAGRGEIGKRVQTAIPRELRARSLRAQIRRSSRRSEPNLRSVRTSTAPGNGLL